MSKGAMTYAHTIRDGDLVVVGGAEVRVAAVRRAQGRKPARGENLHFLDAGGDRVTVNSQAPVRVLKRAP